MLGFIDKRIEKLFLRALHKKRNKAIGQTVQRFIDTHHPGDAIIIELTEKLNEEVDRVCTMADRSILRERIQRARFTFWVTATIGTIITVSVASFPVTTSIAPFFVPLMTAFTAWAVTIGTIPIGYNQRVKGGIDSIVLLMEKQLHKQNDYQKSQRDIVPVNTFSKKTLKVDNISVSNVTMWQSKSKRLHTSSQDLENTHSAKFLQIQI